MHFGSSYIRSSSYEKLVIRDNAKLTFFMSLLIIVAVSPGYVFRILMIMVFSSLTFSWESVHGHDFDL